MDDSHAREDLERVLGQQHDGRAHRVVRRALLIAVAMAALIALAWFYSAARDSARGVRYQTEAIVHGDITVTVSATGNLQPTNKVDVGSELSGIIEAVLVDNNDAVRKGQVLARL